MNKWLNFHTSHSPIDIEVNQGNANITADWSRLDWDNTFINGEKLSSVMDAHEISKNALGEKQAAEVLKDFFSNAILLDYKDSNKEQALETLMKSFHQGGLLHPVSAGMSHVFATQGFGPSARDSPKQVNIKTTSNGLVLQEVYTVKKCNLEITATDELNSRFEDSVIKPDVGKHFVLKAQATIDISFEKDGKLNTKISNQGISYGNKFVKNIADKRNWLSKFIDGLKNIFGKNAVKDISEPEKTNDNVAKPSFKM